MLLAEQLALIALDPDSGRAPMGTRDNLNACLAGLLVAEVHLDDRPESALLTAAGEVFEQAGPKMKAVLSAMSRGLDRRLGLGTWDAVIAGLVDAGVVALTSGGLRPRNEVLDRSARDAIIGRLRAVAANDDPMQVRTALLLSMTGPAQLLELIAPERSGRRHARERIDHALDGTFSQPIADSVRAVIAEAAAAVAASVVAVTVVTSASS
jgi:Golgi phosphoprotein 3 (GPP34)